VVRSAEGILQTRELPAIIDAIAPDGSDVRLLVASVSASMAHFALAPGATSVAVAHRTLDELWYFLGGTGEMWRAPKGLARKRQCHSTRA